MKNALLKIKNLCLEHKKFVIPMIIILVCVSMVMFYGYCGFVKIIKNNIDVMSNNTLYDVVHNIDGEFFECSREIEVIVDEIKISADMQEAAEKIRLFEFSMKGLYGTDLCSISMIYDGMEYSYIDESYKISDEPWYDEIFVQNERTNIFSTTYNGEDRIVLEYSLDQPPIAIALAFNEEKFYRNIYNKNNLKQNVYIINEDGLIVAANGDEPENSYTSIIGKRLDTVITNKNTVAHIMQGTEGAGSYKFNGEKYHYYYSSVSNEWRIAIVIKESVLYSDINNMNRLWTVLTMCIIIVIILLYYKSYKNNLEKESAMKTQAAFFANMSHEIRTPLNAIIGMSEIILRRNISTEVRNDAHAIHNAGTGLLSIINDILDLSKLESGRFEIINDEYYFPALISEVVNLISFRLQHSEVDFIININPDMPVRLIGDEVRLKQILMNLLGNAVKFTKSGYIKTEIDWSYIENGETTLTIKVKDTGMGIKQEEIGSLFLEFKQADKKRNRTMGGTGLGLSISKRLAEQMGGTITVESEYGKGTEFTVTIKNKVKKYEPIAVIHENKKHRVIIYENDPVILQNLRHTFKSFDVLYTVCKTPEELLHSCEGTHLLFRTKWRRDIAKVFKKLEPKPRVIEVTDIAQGAEEYAVEHKHIFLPLIGFQIADFLNEDFSGETVFTYDTRDVVAVPDAKILIVDDNPTNMAVAKGILAQYRMQIDTADNGEDAIQMVKNKKYDMVFMDNMMPGMSGIEATKRIRASVGRYFKNLPIIALTAMVSRTTKEEFLSKGFSDYLSKPMDLNKLDAILHKYLEHKIVKLANMESVEIADSISNDVPVDFDTGIQQLGGNRQVYMEILKVFINDMKKKRTSLTGYISSGDMNSFTIDVHAVKGAAANVRADRLSSLAADMEQLGKNRDLISVRQKIGELMDEMVKVVVAAEDFLDNADRENTADKKKPLKNFVDSQLLSKIKIACDELDMMSLEEIAKEINRFSYPDTVNEWINVINTGILEFDYGKIMEAADKLLMCEKIF